MSIGSPCGWLSTSFVPVPCSLRSGRYANENCLTLWMVNEQQSSAVSTGKLHQHRNVQACATSQHSNMPSNLYYSSTRVCVEQKGGTSAIASCNIGA